jgi:hypothetical protein
MKIVLSQISQWAELFGRSFELVVAQMPLEIDQAPRDLGDEADDQETNELVFSTSVGDIDLSPRSQLRMLWATPQG